jgi:hypothetical protein
MFRSKAIAHKKNICRFAQLNRQCTRLRRSNLEHIVLVIQEETDKLISLFGVRVRSIEQVSELAQGSPTHSADD